MKLTFFANIELVFYKNFKKKIIGQLDNFNRQGYNTNLIIEHNTNFIRYISFLKKILICDSEYIFIRAVGMRSILMFPIIIFLRFKGKKIVLEVPTAISSVLYEFKLNRNKRFVDFIYFILMIIFGPFYLFSFNKIVGYLPERFPFNLFLNKKFYLETNSYDVKKINFFKKKKIIKNDFNCVLVGSIAPWHGVERILNSIKLYELDKNKIKLNLYIVGELSDYYKSFIRKFIADHNLKNNIYFMGNLYEEKLYDAYTQMHIGLGSLGLSKVNNRIRSELKIREYTSVGLPFVFEADDFDFSSKSTFLYKVDYGNSVINFAEIIAWYNTLDSNIPLIMRKYALNKLDFSNKIYKYFE